VAFPASPDIDQIVYCGGNGDCTNGFRAANQDLDPIGGTSASAPAFAGVVALLDQFYGGRQGDINQNLYRLAGVSADAFHDVTTGDNRVPCKAGSTDCPSSGVFGYVATAGYDQTTGLGSVDVNNLVNEWEPDFRLSASPSTLTIGAGASGTVTVTIAALGGFSGTVNLSCSVPTTLVNTTCSIPSTIASSGTAMLTITNSSAAAAFPPLSFGDFHAPGAPSLPFALLVLGAGGAALLIRSRQRIKALGYAAAFSCILLMTACGGGNDTGTTTETMTAPPVTANVTITATSGAISHTTTVSVTTP